MSTYILGISAYYHDSAACLLRDGRIVAAAQEERFTRKKHDADFPARAVEYCLREAEIPVARVDYVGFYDKPFLKFERLLDSYLGHAPRGVRSFWESMPSWMKSKIWMREHIRRELDYEGPVLFAEHHESHAASAFYPSPFDEAAILTIDGVGEWATTTYGLGRGNQFELLAEVRFPHSLGLLYTAFTYYLGFRVNSGEYKVMGLAPYGEPRYKDLILEKLIDLKPDGSFRLNQDYFNYTVGLRMTNHRFHRLFGGPPRAPEGRLDERHMDVARSIQEVTEEAMLRQARHLHEVTGQRYLCLAGGVALNCVANGRILREGPYEALWIQPAAGDAGGALGVASYICHRYLGKEREPQGGAGPEGRGDAQTRRRGERQWEGGRLLSRGEPAVAVSPPRVAASRCDAMQAALLGPAFPRESIERFLEAGDITATRLDADELPERIAQLMDEGRVIGWFQGRMEFGPRALGARSILADPRRRDMQSKLNLKIKFRESFRPFAPSVLRERTSEYFELDCDSPYMLLTAPVREEHRRHDAADSSARGLEKLRTARSDIPAVTHVDYSARIQTVSRPENPRYHALLQAFAERTGCPVVINTSFNVRGEPIVCTPADAYRCFLRTDIDHLVLGDYLIDKRDQDRPAEAYQEWRKELPLD